MNASSHPLPAPAESPAILSRLRLETRPFHDAVEANAFNRALTAGTVTTAEAAHFLARMYGFVQPYEETLRRHAAEFGPEWGLNERFRASCILRDLAQLARAPALPPCPTLPPLHTRAQRLGAMYVLEGSTLGGQVIARQLTQAGIPLTAFFSARGPRTGPLWKQFCQLLTAEAAAAAPAQQDQLVESARLTFQSLTAWIQHA